MNPYTFDIKRSKSAIFCVVAGGLMSLSLPPFPLGFLVYAALAVALHASGALDVESPVSYRTILARTWLFGSVFHFASLYWIGWVAIPGMLFMVFGLGFYIAVVFTVCAAFIRAWGLRAIWSFPVVWIAHEYLRGLGGLAFPWTNLSLTQVGYPRLIQYADLTGDLGCGLVVALVSVLILRIAQRIRSARQQPVALHVIILVTAFAIPYLHGRGEIARYAESTDTVRVAVLQGDIDSKSKWSEGFTDRSIAVYEAQTRQAARLGSELVVWPETAVPMYLRAEPSYRLQLRRLTSELSVPLLVGTLEYERLGPENYRRFNAAVSITHGEYITEYHAKLQLVPFGEWIPFSDRFQILDRLDVGGAHFSAGNHYVLFDHPKGPFAAAICFESAFPDIVRRFAVAGARFFVNITNDGWYGFTSGPTQHAALAVFRCIENRRPLARSANTGISGFIDRVGRFHNTTRQYVPDVRVWDLPLGPRDHTTFFMRHGMWVGRLCTGLTGILLVTVLMQGLWRRRTIPPHTKSIETTRPNESL